MLHWAPPAPHAIDDPAAIIADREQGRLLWAIAERLLNDTQRAALWLRYAEELSYGDIARVLGKTTVSVRVALHRARGVLAAAMPAAEAAPRIEFEKSLAGDLTC